MRPTEQQQNRRPDVTSRAIGALAAHRLAALVGLVLAASVVGLYAYVYASGVRAEHERTRAEIARITASNEEIERTATSPEAAAAWLEHVREVDALWAANLAKIPPAERAEEQYDKLVAMTAKAGVKQLAFERLNLSKVEPAPGASPAAGETATSVSPAIEVRRVKITFLANAGSLAKLLAEVQAGGDERMTSVSEYSVAVVDDQPGYSMRVEMILNAYFKKRDAVAAAPAGVKA